jgi:tRNA dimethylallyltransferase
LELPAGDGEAVMKRTQALRQESDRPETWKKRYQDLLAADPVYAGKLHPNDHYRIARALAALEVTGKPLSQLQRQHGFRDCPYETVEIALSWPRQELYARIDERVAGMVDRGLETEIELLVQAGVSEAARAFQGLAYRWFIRRRRGLVSLEEALAKTQRDSRRFAKRQLTWFRPLSALAWLPGNLPSEDLVKTVCHKMSRLL